MQEYEVEFNAEHERLLRDAGLHPLSPTWAKLEILIGLAAAAIGLLCGMRGVLDLAAAEAWPLMVARADKNVCPTLQTLGGYLALAGHRSHLYQSQNKLVAYLAAQLRRQADDGRP